MHTTSIKWKQPHHRETMQTTHRADYKPFSEHYMKMFQYRIMPTPPSYDRTRPPKMEDDILAKSRRYCYKTSNSIYGSSCFTQKGKCLTATVLGKKTEPAPPKEEEQKEAQAGSPSTGDEKKPSAAPPKAESTETPTSTTLAATSDTTATTTPTTNSSSDKTSSPSSAAKETSVSAAATKQCSDGDAPTVTSPAPSSAAPDTSSAKDSKDASPGNPSIKATGKCSDTSVVKDAALPVAGDATKAADKLPQIGSGEGGLAQQVPPKREAWKLKSTTSYEDFLRDMCNSVRQERLLNQRCATKTSAVLTGLQTQHSAIHKGHVRKFPQDDISSRLFSYRLPRRLCFVSEYTDKFGLLQRPSLPPSAGRNLRPATAVRAQVVTQQTPALAPAPGPLAPKRCVTMCSEYTSSYRHPSTRTIRPKTG
ncbi:mucin-2-like [Engraulis encrasicolus]|uniref:mucin-2-like n=1 Tax=Engraulis encrasicolus TaxID=184585 RepID=UPI002FD10476